MSCIRSWLVAAAVAALPIATRAADDKPAPKTNEPPRITMVAPFAVAAGTNTIIIHGLNLTNATAVRVFAGTEEMDARILSSGKATLPEKADPKKIGDTQIEALLVLPDATSNRLSLVISTPDGESNTNRLRVLDRKLLLDEKEQNGSLRKPNAILIPQFVRGTIDPAGDVDVFGFQAKSGRKLRISTSSANYGSLLDPLLTIYDSRGHVLAVNDDADGTVDAAIVFTVPHDGDYCISIGDAHDRGGVGYTYLVEVDGL